MKHKLLDSEAGFALWRRSPGKYIVTGLDREHMTAYHALPDEMDRAWRIALPLVDGKIDAALDYLAPDPMSHAKALALFQSVTCEAQRFAFSMASSPRRAKS